MKVMFIIFILSFGFSLDENGEIGFSYGVLGRLKSQEEKITISVSSVIEDMDGKYVEASDIVFRTGLIVWPPLYLVTLKITWVAQTLPRLTIVRMPL